jgi:hypothetical protein
MQAKNGRKSAVAPLERYVPVPPQVQSAKDAIQSIRRKKRKSRIWMDIENINSPVERMKENKVNIKVGG